MDSRTDPLYVRTPLALAGLSIVLGVALGAAVNVLNGVVSPTYFRRVMGWRGDVTALAVLQGAVEGAVSGFFFGVFAALVVTAVTRLRCPLRPVVGVVPAAFVLTFVCWALGGMVGAALAFLAPAGVSTFLPLAPTQATARARFLWVGGSIWGAYLGAAVSLVYLVAAVRRRWRVLQWQAAGFAVLAPLPVVSAPVDG